MKYIILVTILFFTGCSSSGFGSVPDVKANLTPTFYKTSKGADEVFYCLSFKLESRSQKLSTKVSPDKTKGELVSRALWITSIITIDNAEVAVRVAEGVYINWTKDVNQMVNECI